MALREPEYYLRASHWFGQDECGAVSAYLDDLTVAAGMDGYYDIALDNAAYTWKHDLTTDERIMLETLDYAHHTEETWKPI